MMAQQVIAMVRGSGLQRMCMTILPSTMVALLQSPVWAQDSAVGSRTGGGLSQGWQVRPSLSITENFSDNLSLAPVGFERTEWTTRVRPAIALSGNSARLRFNAIYAPEQLYRANQGTADTSHFFSANGNAELLSRTFFVEVRSGVSQQNVSLLGPQPDSNLNTTSNRTTVRTHGISPYFLHDFGGDATGELRFTHEAVRLGGNNNFASDNTSNRIDAKLASGPAYKLITWNLALSKSHIRYEQTGQKIDPETVSATVGRLVAPELRLNATVGYEDSGVLGRVVQQLKGTFWSVGPEWTPSPRTHMSATYGQRYFGPSRGFHLDHRSRLAVWGLDYSEGVTSTRTTLTVQAPSVFAALKDAQLQSDPQFQDPVVRAAEVERQIAATPGASLTEPLNFLTDSLFLEKRLQGSFAIQGARNTLATNVFSSNRKALSAGAGRGADFNSSQSVKQTGVSLSWNSRLTETITSNMSLGITRFSFGDLNRTDRFTNVPWSLTKQFDPKVTGSFGFGKQRNSNNVAVGGYSENSASLAMDVRF